jgi:hypothetical protein
MKALKLSLVIMAAALLTIGLSGMAYAFHSGGVGSCEGCHTMHNSSGGAAMFGHGGHTINPIGKTQYTGVAYLLQGSDQSSTCLNCHARTGGFGVLTYNIPAPGTGPSNYTPGGDFAWLAKTWGTSASGKGERHGHNIIAADFGFPLGDTTLTTAPGGSYSASNLTCISCHDPHPSARYDTTDTLLYSKIGTSVPPIIGSGSTGTQAGGGQAVGTYRFLGGVGYKPFSNSEAGFTAPPPVAISPSTYNMSENTNDCRVAYGQGMSEWCANCHGNGPGGIHGGNADGKTAPFIHPAGAGAVLSANANIGGSSTTIAAIYDAYKGSGDLTGLAASSYWSLVPYEEGVGRAQLRTNGHAGNTGGALQIVGPSGSENVMCVSCHRVHASGFSSMGRWDFGAQLITNANTAYNYSTSNSATAPQSELEYEAAMNGRLPGKFVSYQRNLCNKCHGKD